MNAQYWVRDQSFCFIVWNKTLLKHEAWEMTYVGLGIKILNEKFLSNIGDVRFNRPLKDLFKRNLHTAIVAFSRWIWVFKQSFFVV